MKTYKLAVLAAVTLLSWTGARTASAQSTTNIDTNRFRAVVNLVCISTNDAGHLKSQSLDTADFIRACAADAGISNLAGLELVFDRTNNALEVIRRTNDDILCTPLSFEDHLSLTNTNDTHVVLQSFVFVGTNDTAGGLLSATERLTWRTNGLTSFSLRGRLSYTEAADGTNSAMICRGSLLVGRGIIRADDDDDNDDCDRDRDRDRDDRGRGDRENSGRGRH